jgi:hypothetical protein
MKTLKRPSWDPIEDFDAILSVKRKPQAKKALTEARSAVLSSASRYRTCAPDLESFQGAQLDAGSNTHLLNCFDARKRTKPCKAMLNRLRMLNPEVKKCPLCGIDNAKTFDHYLPQALFPDLAICAYNLVPACFRCNNLRGKRWTSERGRSLVHLYYDWIPADTDPEAGLWMAPVLEANVATHTGHPTAHYYVAANVDSPGFPGQFVRHCDALELLALFDDNASEILIDIVEDFRGECPNVETVKSQFQQTAEKRALRHGANHWEAALYRGAARSDDFIMYLLAGRAP